MEVAFFYVDAGAAAYAAFRVAAEFAASRAVRHYSNALAAYIWLLLAVLVLVPILVMSAVAVVVVQRVFLVADPSIAPRSVGTPAAARVHMRGQCIPPCNDKNTDNDNVKETKHNANMSALVGSPGCTTLRTERIHG